MPAQSGLLEARIVEGDGQVNLPGARLSHPLIIKVTDETGTRVRDAVVSFRIPDDGPTGTFRNGLKTEILHTDADGRATLRNLIAGGIAGQFQVRMTVAKGDSRAGVISTQFVAPAPLRSGLHAGVLRPHRRAMEIGAVALTVAVAGYVKQSRSSGSSTVQLPPTIGPPTVTVGKP